MSRLPVRQEVLIVSWGGGGNVPPLLAAGRLLADCNHHISVLASAATRQAAVDAGFDVVGYRRTSDPEMDVAFEAQAAPMMSVAAGLEIALDVCEFVAELAPDLLVVDCMLPAGLAAGEATGTPTASLVHFPYGPARRQLLRGIGAWTTDRAELDRTRARLGLEPTRDELAAWESVGLLLVTVPTWFDLAGQYPSKVVHAGPLGVTHALHERREADGRPLVLLSFSTTVMHGQAALIERVCDAIGGQSLDAVLTLGPAVGREAIRPPANVAVTPYADHDQLLPRCAAVVTHGGLGTTLRALAHGTPLLLLPLGRDQQFNAARVVEIGAGIRLPAGASPGEIGSALDELVTRPRYTDAAAAAANAITIDEPDTKARTALLAVMGSR